MHKEGKESTTQKKQLTSCLHGLELLLVQSIVCILVLAVSLIIKAMNGNALTTVSELFHRGIYEGHLFTAVSASVSQSGTTVTTQTTTSAVATTANSTVPVMNAVSADTSPQHIVPPLEGGIITSAYGERIDPITGNAQSFHDGVDIAADSGTPLCALMNGVVTDVGYEENGYGWYVIVDCHEGYQYLYAHCREISVEAGRTVTAGETVAFVGNTGRSTGNHLHFEWRVNGEAVDPMTILPTQTYA